MDRRRVIAIVVGAVAVVAVIAALGLAGGDGESDEDPSAVGDRTSSTRTHSSSTTATGAAVTSTTPAQTQGTSSTTPRSPRTTSAAPTPPDVIATPPDGPPPTTPATLPPTTTTTAPRPKPVGDPGFTCTREGDSFRAALSWPWTDGGTETASATVSALGTQSYMLQGNRGSTISYKVTYGSPQIASCTMTASSPGGQ